MTYELRQAMWRSRITPNTPSLETRLDELTRRVAKLEACLQGVSDDGEPTPFRGRITGRMVQHAVSEAFNVLVVDLVSSRREARVVQPRQACAYLMRRLTTLSLPHIGEQLGGRDHSTIMHAIRMTTARCEADPKFGAKIGQLEAQLRAAAKEGQP